MASSEVPPMGETVYAGDLTGKHELVLIFLHGVGQQGAEVVQDFTTHCDLQGLKVKLVCPTARKIHCTVFDTAKCAWFDPPLLAGKMDEAGFVRSLIDIHSLIKAELQAGTPLHRIVLGGFSQGGCIANHIGLMAKDEIAGMLLLSCFTLGEPPRPIPANLEVPWFWGHGDRDTVVRLAQAKEAVAALEKVGRSVDLHVYPGVDHVVSSEELKDVKTWLGAAVKRVNNTTAAAGRASDGGLEGLESNVRLLEQRAHALLLTPDALNGMSTEQLRDIIGQFATTTLDRTALQKVANACVRVTTKARQ